MTLETCNKLLKHYISTGQTERAKDMEVHIKAKTASLDAKKKAGLTPQGKEDKNAKKSA